MPLEEIGGWLILLSEAALQDRGSDMAIIQIRHTSEEKNNGGFVLLFKIMLENTRQNKQHVSCATLNGGNRLKV